MKVETLEHLILWAASIHRQLGECLGENATRHEQGTARMLMEYLADQEATMAELVDGFRQKANANALETWLYDWLEHPPLAPERIARADYQAMSFGEIVQTVLGVHSEVTKLLRLLLVRADIPDAAELIEELLDLEDNQSRQIAQQANRISDM